MGRPVAIVLAAGASRRMGRDKLLLPWGRGCVLESALAAYTGSSEIGGTILVVRPGFPQPVGFPQNTPRVDLRVVVNPDAAEGMGVSLRVGVAACAETEAFVVGLGDLPSLGPELVSRAIRAWRASGRGILVPTFQGRRGHPVVLAERYRSELLACEGDIGAREILQAHADDLTVWECGDPAVVMDLDVPGDLAGGVSPAVAGIRSPHDIKVLVRGAGEQATATAHRLFRCGFRVAMTEVERPTAVRLTVSFCSAIYDGQIQVEGVRAARWDPDRVADLDDEPDHVPVFVDPGTRVREAWKPDVVVDARILKYNAGNSVFDAPLVIGLGPGLCAGRDVHLVIETDRGHDLGRIITAGLAAPDSGLPGLIAGVGRERILRAPVAGPVWPHRRIGDSVHPGEIVCHVGPEPVVAGIPGILRGIVHAGLEVPASLKIGDIDPRGDPTYCHTLSDKARTISGSVLEAILSTFCGRS